jgi:thiazole synthase ThiGH ThiG subunit
MNEQQLREQIAQEILKWEIVEDTTNLNPQAWELIKKHFAAIARGDHA